MRSSVLYSTAAVLLQSPLILGAPAGTSSPLPDTSDTFYTSKCPPGQSFTLPFTSGSSFGSAAPKIDISIDSTKYTKEAGGFVSTSFTGLLVPSYYIKNLDALVKAKSPRIIGPGAVFSPHDGNTLWIGKWVDNTPITVYPGAKSARMMRMPVFAITETVKCPRYDPDTDGSSCPTTKATAGSRVTDMTAIYNKIPIVVGIAGGPYRPTGMDSRIVNPFRLFSENSKCAGWVLTRNAVSVGLDGSTVTKFQLQTIPAKREAKTDPQMDYMLLNMKFCGAKGCTSNHVYNVDIDTRYTMKTYLPTDFTMEGNTKAGDGMELKKSLFDTDSQALTAEAKDYTMVAGLGRETLENVDIMYDISNGKRGVRQINPSTGKPLASLKSGEF